MRFVLNADRYLDKLNESEGGAPAAGNSPVAEPMETDS